MTNDLISQAEALLGRFAALKEHAKLKPNAVIFEMIDIRDALIEMVPGLVEEIKRLQSDNDFLHKFVDDPGSTLEAALNAVREQSEVIRKQQAAFAATLTKWQQIAIDERAQIIQYHRGILHPLDRPSNFWESMPKDEYAECSDLAAKELGLQAAQDDTGEELTIAYMLGSKNANDRLKALQDYVGRLEPKYIDSNAARRYYADGYEAPWPQVGNEFKERYIKDALAALEKIRRG